MPQGRRSPLGAFRRDSPVRTGSSPVAQPQEYLPGPSASGDEIDPRSLRTCLSRLFSTAHGFSFGNKNEYVLGYADLLHLIASDISRDLTEGFGVCPGKESIIMGRKGLAGWIYQVEVGRIGFKLL
jgi:hypothetical protein